MTDFTLEMAADRPFTILQLTDMQIIDAEQRRRPDRLRQDEIDKWHTEMVENNFYAPVRRLTEAVRPDLIIITGDMVYGEFDDAGTAWAGFVAFMDSLNIPWAPLFGNHDNESARGIDWQCRQLTDAPNCFFARGTVSGNSNYTLALTQNGRPVRVLYMMDTNACYGGTDPAICRRVGPAEDQLAWLADTAAALTAQAGRPVPGFLCCHIPPVDYNEAVVAAGYQTPDTANQPGNFRIGTDLAPAHPGDSGCKNEVTGGCGPRLAPLLKAAGIDGVFAGHYHKCNLSVENQGIRYTLGVKTGTYDYHAPDQLGGTKITLPTDRTSFAVEPVYLP